MRRLTVGLFALALIATACGSGDSAEEVLVELGLSDAEAACFSDEYDARGLDMDEMLTADADDLSSDELQTVLEIATTCSDTGAAATTDDTSGDDGTASTDEDSTDDADDADDPVDALDPAESADEPADDPEVSEEPDDGSARTYDDLTALEQAFVDGLTETGGTREVGICILTEFEAAGISILDLAEFGLDDTAEPSSDMMAAIFRCGEELADAGAFDTDDFFGGASDANTYGDDAELDALWDACAAGDLNACDDLWWDSPIGSDYESFGSTCGETTAPTFGGCSDDGGSDSGTDLTPDANAYGDDPALDALYDSCAGGDLAACDDLWFSSGIGSEYEAYAESCGGLSADAVFGTCESTFG